MTREKPNCIRPPNLHYPSTREFWMGLKKRQFLTQKCLACNEVFFPPRSHCPQCLGNDLEWVELSDKGTLHSWTQVYMARSEFDTPYLLGLVDLSDGLGRITGKIIGAEAGQLRIGMPVKFSYTDIDEDFTIYCIAIEK